MSTDVRPAEAMVVERRHVEAHDRDGATALVEELFGSQCTCSGEGETHFSLTSATAGPLRADHVSSSLEVSRVVDPAPGLTILHTVRGTSTLSVWGEEHEVRPGDSVLTPVGVPTSLHCRGFEKMFLTIPFDRVAAVAERTTGCRPGGFRFTGVRPVSAAWHRHWVGMLRYVFATLAASGSPAAHPLVNDQLVESAALTTLKAFPNPALAVPRTRSARVSLATVTRAEAYMEQHAADPISIHEVADAAGTGVRALQQAFQRRRGLSPAAFLRATRLARAHDDLVAADPEGTTGIDDIARRWGFPNPRRFAAEFRATYGCSPTEAFGSG